MSLHISKLKILANTSDGKYGVEIPFEAGLFVLRVENTHGKSTCLNAIAYALGMEKALGLSGAKLPFPPSLTKALEDHEGKEINIISSMVFLEIKNSKGEIVTLKRQIVGSDEDNVIDCFASDLSKVTENHPQRLFLHLEGDTSRRLGFFKWLDEFIGWQLPLVPTQEGKEVPLYPATFFPTWFVEQKKGWASIQATTPAIFRIKDAKKRAIEFILKLDVNDIVKKRARIKADIEQIVTEWKVAFKRSEMLSARVLGQLSGVPEVPEAKFDKYKIDISIKDQKRWNSIITQVDVIKKGLSSFNEELKVEQEVSRESEEIQAKIEASIAAIKCHDEMYLRLDDEISYLRHQIFITEKRLKSLGEDKRKYEDLKKVQASDVFAGSSMNNSDCPVCGQSCADNLMALGSHGETMSLEESLTFVKEQIKAFKSVCESYAAQLQKKNTELVKVREDLRKARVDLRTLKEGVLSPSVAIKEEVLRKKIRLESDLELYQKTIVELSELRLQFDSLHSKYKSLTAQRKSIPENSLSTLDYKKLKKLQEYLRESLAEYGFSSFAPDKLEISKDSYLPTREGFDIGFDTSASDGIRIIWSYLIGLFRLQHDFEINHPGVLIFDEPRQQEANKFSFSQLLQTTSRHCQGGGQVILATSEEESVLKESLGDVSYTLKSFDKQEGKIIRKIEEA